MDHYRKVLESFSKPRLDFIEWKATPDGNVEGLNDTIDLYRYFDATKPLMDLIEARHGKASTIVCSQIPISAWHQLIGEATIADAILDRLVYSSHRLQLKGESLRKKQRLTP